MLLEHAAAASSPEEPRRRFGEADYLATAGTAVVLQRCLLIVPVNPS